jgi:deoxyribodipyrimidine photo-lyase
MAPTVPEVRITRCNRAPLHDGRDWVLYWMVAQRRAGWNFALQHAVELAQELGKPLLVLEALRCDYRWASDRLHAFVLQGLADNRRSFARAGVPYRAYVEPEVGAGRGLLAALAARACAVVTDDAPYFFLPRMRAAAAAQLDVALLAVDSNGLSPLHHTERVFTTAASFRRHLQKELPQFLTQLPKADPLRGQRWPECPPVGAAIDRRWPEPSPALLAAEPQALRALPIDHTVPLVADRRGGTTAARERLAHWLEHGLPHYHELRNQPDHDVPSGLSPWLHFGHLSAHEVFAAVTARDGWQLSDLAPAPNGSREGWWGASPAVEAFLDELITWREIGYHQSARDPHYDQFRSLPAFAHETLEEHAADRREHVYSLAEFEAAATHDPLWNAAQRELLQTGRLHNYLRMLWGKKVLEWTREPREAFAILVELNNKYALDGRNPNSYSGIAWCFGRYDRAWGPERPIFGKVRYMSSENTARKLHLDGYLARFGGEGLFS